MEHQILRRVFREVDRRSDDLQQASVWVVESQGTLTRSQANGLWSVVSCEDNINTITLFAQRQAAKSTSRNSGFWSELKRELEGLRKQAEEIQQKLGLETDGKKMQKEQRDEIHLLLARDYVQHLVAHILFRLDR